MQTAILIITFILSYVVGSLNSAIIVTFLLKHKDIRQYGSFNAGLTNVYRCFGVTAAAFTMLMDLLKGVVVVYGTRFVMSLSMFDGFKLDTFSVTLISVFFAVIGHCFPAFYGFKGGKGILLAAVCMLLTDPVVFLCEAVMFAILVGTTKYISVGSMAACVGYPIFTMIWQYLANTYLGYEYENIWLHGLIILPMFFVCFFRHFSNIQHLWRGEEKRFYLHKKGEDE